MDATTTTTTTAVGLFLVALPIQFKTVHHIIASPQPPRTSVVIEQVDDDVKSLLPFCSPKKRKLEREPTAATAKATTSSSSEGSSPQKKKQKRRPKVEPILTSKPVERENTDEYEIRSVEFLVPSSYLAKTKAPAGDSDDDSKTSQFKFEFLCRKDEKDKTNTDAGWLVAAQDVGRLLGIRCSNVWKEIQNRIHPNLLKREKGFDVSSSSSSSSSSVTNDSKCRFRNKAGDVVVSDDMFMIDRKSSLACYVRASRIKELLRSHKPFGAIASVFDTATKKVIDG